MVLPRLISQRIRSVLVIACYLGETQEYLHRCVLQMVAIPINRFDIHIRLYRNFTSFRDDKASTIADTLTDITTAKDVWRGDWRDTVVHLIGSYLIHVVACRVIVVVYAHQRCVMVIRSRRKVSSALAY